METAQYREAKVFDENGNVIISPEEFKRGAPLLYRRMVIDALWKAGLKVDNALCRKVGLEVTEVVVNDGAKVDEVGRSKVVSASYEELKETALRRGKR